MPFQIRKFLPQDFEIVNQWSIQQKWNPGLYDYIAFRNGLDPDGFWMGVLDGKPIGCVGIVQYDQNWAYVGLYLVKKQYRRQGYGYQIWKKAMSRITAKNVSLEGVMQQQPNYVKSGFKTQHKTSRYQVYGTNNSYHSQNLVECLKVNIQDLSKYDRKCFPAERKQFLKSWISLPQSKSIAYVQNGNLKGYGVLRVSDQGYRIGPLYGDNYKIAEQILKSLIGSVSEDKLIFMDVPLNNQNALKLAKNFNMKYNWEFAKMYTNGLPNVQLENVYGVCSIQFG